MLMPLKDFMYSFNKHLLSTYFVQGNALNFGNVQRSEWNKVPRSPICRDRQNGDC